MIIALFPKFDAPDSIDLARQIITFFAKHRILVVVEEDKVGQLNVPPLSSVSPQEITFLITMGGDGSILRIAHAYSHLSGAILGINLGHLGFMADVQIGEVIPCLEDLLAGKFTIQKRLALKGKKGAFSDFAINDFVFHRAQHPHLAELALYVDDLLLNSFQADGVILSTPNGSTAYSLAAGGPITSPTLDAIVITPICPHTISNRPIVVDANCKIRVESRSSLFSVEVVVDGLHKLALSQGESLEISRREEPFPIVQLDRIDYFTTLRKKLSWSGRLRQP